MSSLLPFQRTCDGDDGQNDGARNVDTNIAPIPIPDTLKEAPEPPTPAQQNWQNPLLQNEPEFDGSSSAAVPSRIDEDQRSDQPDGRSSIEHAKDEERVKTSNGDCDCGIEAGVSAALEAIKSPDPETNYAGSPSCENCSAVKEEGNAADDQEKSIVASVNKESKQKTAKAGIFSIQSCAAGKFCRLPNTPLTSKSTDGQQQLERCIECKLLLHGVPHCGFFFDETHPTDGTTAVTKDDLVNGCSSIGMSDESVEGSLCWTCVRAIYDKRASVERFIAECRKRRATRKRVRDERQSRIPNKKACSEEVHPAKITQISNKRKFDSNITVNATKENKAETPKPTPNPKKDDMTTKLNIPPKQRWAFKKDRIEFTAAQKLELLSELDSDSPPKIQDLLKKHGVSKSSLFRWKNPRMRERLVQMVEQDGRGSKKRDMKNPLERITEGLKEFYEENSNLPLDEQLAFTSSVIQARAIVMRDELMEIHKKEPFLTVEEVKALKEFKATKSWAGKVGTLHGWTSSRGRSSGNDSTNKKEKNDGNAQVGENGQGVELLPLPPLSPIKASQAARENTAKFLSQTVPDKYKPKKERKEFSVQEKLSILQELEDSEGKITVEGICEKYGASKSSLFRWKQQHRSKQLQSKAETSYKRLVCDNLSKVKSDLHQFVEKNREMPPDRRIRINAAIIQGKAQMCRDSLLARHKRDAFLSQEEFEALTSFKASKGWANKASLKYGWRDADGRGRTIGGTEVVADPDDENDEEHLVDCTKHQMEITNMAEKDEDIGHSNIPIPACKHEFVEKTIEDALDRITDVACV